MSDTALNGDLFGHVPDDPVPTRRDRLTNEPTRNSHGTPLERRVKDLFRSFLRDMTNRSAYAQADALAAAELTAGAEEARRRWVAGKGDIDEVVKAERLARHAVRKLGIDRQRAAKPKKTLADYSREKAAEKANPSPAGAAA
jgi:hypothetical protein